MREIYDSWRSEEHQCYKEELTAVDTELGRADLILVFGHNLSLSGKTAQTLSDITRRDYEDLGQSLGLVIISDTNTSLDKFATVRVNQSPDLALESLQEMMEITSPSLSTVTPVITITEPALDVTEVGSAPPADPAHCEETSPPPPPTTEELPTAEGAGDGGGDGGDSGDAGGGGDGGGGGGPEKPCADSSHRAYIADALTHFKEIQPEDPRIYHGRILSETCLEEPDQSEDREHTRTYKLEKLIDLVKVSHRHHSTCEERIVSSFVSLL